MIEKINLEKTNAWPFVEAKKILKEREKFFYKFDGKSGYRVSQILLKNIK